MKNVKILVSIVVIIIIIVIVASYSNKKTDPAPASAPINTVEPVATQSPVVSQPAVSTPVATPVTSVAPSSSYVTVGSANSVSLLATRLSSYGYKAKSSYFNLLELISDIQSQKNKSVKLVSAVNVGGTDGYEMSIDGRAVVWVEKNTIVHTFSFDKVSPLSSQDKQMLSKVILN